MNERLYRSRDDRMLAGVAGGLAEIWDADPSLVRIVWALLVVLSGGLALVVYVIMAIVVPEGDAAPRDAVMPPVASAATAATAAASASDRRADRRAARAARRAERGDRGNSAGIVLGAILILVGGAFFVREWWPAIDFDVLWPLALIGLGIVVLGLGLARDRGDGGPAT